MAEDGGQRYGTGDPFPNVAVLEVERAVEGGKKHKIVTRIQKVPIFENIQGRDIRKEKHSPKTKGLRWRSTQTVCSASGRVERHGG